MANKKISQESIKKDKALNTFGTLFEHKFIKKVFTDTQKIFQGDKKQIKTEQDFYTQNVGFHLAHTITWCKQLDLAINLLSNFDYSQKNTSRADHFIYNVENYIIRVNSAYDKILQLTNAVFYLCISDKDVNESMIMRNRKIIQSIQVSKTLKKIKSDLSKYSRVRNNLIHKNSSLMDEAIDTLELFHLPGMLEEISIIHPNFKHVRTIQLREQIKAKKMDYSKTNQTLFLQISGLLELFDEEYNIQKRLINLAMNAIKQSD